MREKYNKMSSKPPLNSYAYLGKFNEKLIYLSKIAEQENWYYDNPKMKTEEEKKTGILYQYIQHTFTKALDDNKILSDENHSIMNTGLLTNQGEEIYMLFNKNRVIGKQNWFFDSFYKESSHDIPEEFRDKLPSHIDYFEQLPEMYYFNPSLKIHSNKDHIINDNFDRLPKAMRELPEDILSSVLTSQITILEKNSCEIID